MQLIGLTGGIGSGKSTIAGAIEALGYPVYNTDREAKRIIVHNPAVRSQVETLFGSDVFDGDIYLTERVAEQVFADKKLLDKLNGIVHPAVAFDLRHWAKLQTQTCFVESALLFSSGLNKLCDKTVWIDAPEELRIARTIARDGSDINKVRARVRAQKDDSALADIILINDGTKKVAQLVDDLFLHID